MRHLPLLLGLLVAPLASSASADDLGFLLDYQTSIGGWPKNTSFTQAPARPPADREATIDNGATTTPLRRLAVTISAAPQPDPAHLAAFARGLDYLLAAQHPHGGWPQFFPLRGGYHDHVTYNDDAMVNVLTLLRDVAAGAPPFAFVEPEHRARAASAVLRGIDCILLTQVRRDGVLTAWCAQHDAHTLAPAWARNFEPPSLSGHESVGIVRFLLSIEQPSPEIIHAIESASSWFQKTRITGLRYERFTDSDDQADRRVVPDTAAPALWARFHDLETDQPLFVGRDRVYRSALAEIERERRTGYAYYTTSPELLLTRDLPRWRTRLGLTPPP
jgi:PelA/Pel-15E family pectate lyase